MRPRKTEPWPICAALGWMRLERNKLQTAPLTHVRGAVCAVLFRGQAKGIAHMAGYSRGARRFARPSPDKQACRSSGGECEPTCVAEPRNRTKPRHPSQTKGVARMGYPFCLAGMAGFEPTNTRVKVWCLTAWRHPNILNTPYIIPFAARTVKSKFAEFGANFAAGSPSGDQ